MKSVVLLQYVQVLFEYVQVLLEYVQVLYIEGGWDECIPSLALCVRGCVCNNIS